MAAGLGSGLDSRLMDTGRETLKLCDEDGQVTGLYMDVLNRLREVSGLKPYSGEPFACTGSTTVTGQTIWCRSKAHERAALQAMVAGTAKITSERVQDGRVLLDCAGCGTVGVWLSSGLAKRAKDEHVCGQHSTAPGKVTTVFLVGPPAQGM